LTTKNVHKIQNPNLPLLLLLLLSVSELIVVTIRLYCSVTLFCLCRTAGGQEFKKQKIYLFYQNQYNNNGFV